MTFDFMKNKREATHVYIAYSPMAELYKVGISKNVLSRLNSLCQRGYAGVSDWLLLTSEDKGAGKAYRVEIDLGRHLDVFNSREGSRGSKYHCEQRGEACYELYECELKDINKALEAVGMLKIGGGKMAKVLARNPRQHQSKPLLPESQAEYLARNMPLVNASRSVHAEHSSRSVTLYFTDKCKTSHL